MACHVPCAACRHVSREASFSFGTPTGDASSGFECRLSSDTSSPSAPNLNSPVLHNWTSCASPKAYKELDEGRYIFQVMEYGVM